MTSKDCSLLRNQVRSGFGKICPCPELPLLAIANSLFLLAIETSHCYLGFCGIDCFIQYCQYYIENLRF